ncbi:MAG: tetratricopeptide repeat protein [Candidatus Acidiferrales bacterium]
MNFRQTAIFLAVGLISPGARAQQSTPPAQTDEARHAEAYSDFAIGHYLETLYGVTGQGDYARQAIDSYKKALELDPDSEAIELRIAETLAESQQIKDAVAEGEAILARNPSSAGAHRLLARIYVRTLGDLSNVSQQSETINKAIGHLEALRKLEPTDTESKLWLARLYRFENKHDEAEAVLREILKQDPNEETALEQLSQLLVDEGRASEAITLLQQSSGASTPEVLDLLGNAYSQNHDYAKAEEAFRQAAQEDPDEANHVRGLAQTLISENKLEEAAEQYKRLTEMEPESGENHLRLSQIYRRLGQLDLAEKNLMEAKQLSPGSIEIMYNEAILYDAQGRFEEAERILTDAIAGIKSQPGGNPGALAILYEQLGQTYRDAENYPAAVRTFEEMGGLSPEAARRAQMQLIDTYRASRDIPKAAEETKKALDTDPENRDLVTSYAMLLGEEQKLADAQKILHALLKGNAEDGEVYLALAQVEERGRDFSDAETDGKQAITLARQPAEKANAYFMLGAIYERQKKYDDAEEGFKQSLALEPQNAAVLNYYGYMLAERNVRLDEAAKMITAAVKQEPTNGAYLDSLGWVYFRQNKLAEAQEYLEKAAAHTPHDPTVLGHLGDVYAKLGLGERAAAAYEKAQYEWQHSLPADYEPDQVAQLDQKLKSLKRRLAQKSPALEEKPL